MRTCRVAELRPRPNVRKDDIVNAIGRYCAVLVVKLGLSAQCSWHFDGRGSFNWQDIGF